MAKGISPLRLFMRGNSKKSLTESDATSSSPEQSSASTTPQRQPLCPIPESMRNPHAPPPAEQSLPESVSAPAATPSKSKTEQPTPRARAKLNFNGQEKYPHLENSEVGIVNGTPEKSANGLSAAAGGPNSKGKYTWQNHHPSNAALSSRTSPAQARYRAQQENVAAEGVHHSHLCTPPRGSKQSSADGSQISTGLSHSNSGVMQQQTVPGSARAGSTQTTPKSSRAARPGHDLEQNQQNGTPGKSVSRALKYAQQQQAGTSNAATGLANVRLTGPQHVVTRTMGILQAVKGASAQTSNNSFVEQQFDLEEDPNFWTDHNVQVLIRTRPLNSSEFAAQGSSRCLKQESPHTLTWLGQPESRYTFDHVAGEYITQEKLFSVAGLPMVENCMSGYNSCMFAYGQTGSGKTHTMLGDIDDLDRRPSDKRGMTPRVFEYLFSKIHMEQESRRAEQLKYFCKCSFLEIYNEQITDLLEPTSTNLQLREDAKKGVYVENLTEVEVHGVQDVIQLLLQGSANRKVASTNMNRESSRSHSVFTCIVESKWEANSMTNSRYGRLHLVDLAGSERQKTSGAEGGRLKEAANINKSLSTLGLVIMILVDVANGKQRHVPYRDSKLTFLLQDSLGGNSKTIMIANVSPSSCNAMETLSTLKFAQRAKFIRNNAVINEDASGDVMVLRQQIQELKVEVDRLRRESISRTPSMRFGSSLQNGSMDGDYSRENVDSSGAVDSSLSPDSAHVKTKAYIIEKKLKGMEAVLAGALRREQVAEDTTKKMAAEIEQLNRLVHQREEDSQCSKMMLRFREDKIRRLEGVTDTVLSAELYYKEEQKALMEELQLIRARMDRNPELTRFAMENIRLMEQLRRYQELYDAGEKDLLLAEISGLRNQLLDVLDAKLGDESGHLTTPQKRALAPEIAARARENELLLIEVQGYQKEVKECRTNLNSCLVANAELTRQVDQMQAMITQLKAECSSKHQEVEALKIARDEERTSGTTSLRTIEELKTELCKNEERWAVESKACLQLQEQLQAALQEAANLRSEIENSRKWREELSSSQAIAERLHSTEASLAAAQETASTAEATVKQIRMETEEIAIQQRLSLTSIEEAAMVWRTQESELRVQLKDAQDQLTARMARDAENEGVVSKSPAKDRLQKNQELEMRHSEEIMHLQLELESVETVLREEQQQRLETEQKVEDLMNQLSEAACKLEHERVLVEAFEGQNLFSIHELENVQAELMKVSNQLKESESKVVFLEDKLEELEEIRRSSERRCSHNDAALHTLQLNLQKARREKEDVRAANERYKLEKSYQSAREREIEDTRTQAETETAFALTSMQEEILELREEVAGASESEALARLQFLQLKHELEEIGNSNKELQSKYDTLAAEKDAELRNLQRDWEGATAKLIDYLAEGDEELIEAAREMDDMVESSFSPRLVGAWKELDAGRHQNSVVSKKQKAFDLLYQHLQEAQSLVRATEKSVRGLGDITPENTNESEAMIRDLERKCMAAFVLVSHLVDRVKELNLAKTDLAEENRELYSAVAEEEKIITALQQKMEDDLSRQDEIAGQYQILMEGHDGLRQELEDAVRESDVLKFQVEDLELKLARSYLVIEKVEAMMVDVELKVAVMEGKALARLEQLVLERQELLAPFLSELDRILYSVSVIEERIVGLESYTCALQGGTSKVKDLEETIVSYRSTISDLQNKLSEAGTILELKDEELERSKHKYEASQLALKEERGLLIQQKEQTQNDSLGKEKMVESLRVQVQNLEANLKQAELKVSEMIRGVEALTIAKVELEIERDRLMIATQVAEKNCSEKEQAVAQIQADLDQLLSRVSEAEFREQSISIRMEELMMAKQEWESEKLILVQEVEDLRAEKEEHEVIISELKLELEEEGTVLKTLSRSQLALEEAEPKLVALDEDLENLERTRGNLEQAVMDMECSVSDTVHGLEEKERELIGLQMNSETLKFQVKLLKSTNEEIVLERIRWMTDKESLEQDKETLKQEYLVSEAQLREQLATAESKLSISARELTSVTARVEKLSALKTELELELAQVNEDALSAMSNLKLREEELEGLRASSDLLKSRCEQTEGKVAAVEILLQQYVMSEESWKVEKAQLVEKLKEVESMSASVDLSSQEDVVECWEVPHALIERLRLQVEGLKRKITQKDNIILSARKEMEVAIANLKEAELEMDKLQAERDTLLKTCEESANTTTSISATLRTAEGELSRRQLQIDALEKEMGKVGDIVNEWEVKMLDAEKSWKIEKEELVKEVDSAKIEAREKGLEAAALTLKFQDGQCTLMEAETLLNGLVRANEKAKHNAQDWKAERDELRKSQEVWEPERDRLVAAIKCLKMELDQREQYTLSIFQESAVQLSETMNLVKSAEEEMSVLKLEQEQEMNVLSGIVKDIRSDLLQALSFPKELERDVDKLCAMSAEQKRNLVLVREHNESLSKELQAAEACVQRDLTEMEALKEKLAASARELERKCWDLQAVESNDAKNKEKLLSMTEELELLEEKLACATSETSVLRIQLVKSESQVSALQNDQSQAVEQHLSKLQTERGMEEVKAVNGMAAEDQVTDLKAEVHELQSQVLSLEQKLALTESELGECVLSSNASIYELTVERDALWKYSNAQSGALSRLGVTMLQKESQIVELHEQILSLDGAVDSTRKELKQRDGLVAERDDALMHLHREMQTFTIDNGTLSEVVSGLQSEKIDAAAKISQLEGEVEETKLRIRDLEQTASKQYVDVAALTDEKNEAHAQLMRQNDALLRLEEELVRLRAEIKEYEEKEVKYQSEIQMSRRTLDTASIEESIGMTHLPARVVQLEDDLEKERSTVRELKEKLVSVDSENSHLVDQLEAQLIAQSTALIGLEEEMLALKEDRVKDQANFCARLSELEETLHEERRGATCLEEKLKMVEEENAQLNCHLDEKVRQLRTERDHFQVKASKVKVELVEGVRTVKDLEEKLAATEQDNGEVLQTLEEKSRKIAQVRDQLEIQVTQQVASLASLQKEMDRMKGETPAKQEYIEVLKVKVELEEGVRTVKDLEEKLAATEQDNGEILQTLEEKSRQLAQVRDQLDFQVTQQGASLATLQDEMARMKEERSAKQECIEKLQSDLEFYKDELEVVRKDAERDFEMLTLSQAEVGVLKQNCKSLVTENDELKCEIIELEGRVLDLQEETERKKKAIGEVELKLKREKEKSLEHEHAQSIEQRDAGAAMAKLERKDEELRKMKVNFQQLVHEKQDLKCRLTELEYTVIDLQEEIDRRKRDQEDLEENSSKDQTILSKTLQDLHVEMDMLQLELGQQLGIQTKLKEELKIAEGARETVSSVNGRLQKCVSDIEQSHALCVNELFTQGLVGTESFKAAQMELKTVREVLEDVQSLSEDFLFGKLGVPEQELCHARSAIHELRGEMKGLLDLTNATESIVCNKLSLIDHLQKELLLRDKHLVELEADRVTTLETLKIDRRWVLKQFHKILKKLQCVSSGTLTGAWPDEESAEGVGDLHFAVTVLEQQMDSIDERLDLVLLENTRMKSEVVTIQSRVGNLEEELDQKGHEVKHLSYLEEELRHKDHELKLLANEQVQQTSNSADLLNVYKHEIEILQQTLLSTVEGLGHSYSNAPDLSSIEQELGLVKESVRRAGLQRMFDDLKEEIYNFQHTVTELQLRSSAFEEELDDKRHHIDLLADDLMLERENSLRASEKWKDEIKVAETERDKLQTEIVVLTEQLVMAQSLSDENEIVAAEAREMAELSKSLAEKKAEEAKILEKSVEELESTVYALESQLGIVKREAEKQRRAKEEVESELGSMLQQMQLMKITIDHQDSQTARDFEDAKFAKTELDRMVIEMKNQQMQTRQTVESLQQECAEKDVQLRSCKAHIADLMSNAEKQASENQQKLKVLESMVEQLKTEERKVSSTATVVSKPADSKNTANKAKGSGSPFKCIGSGLAQQRSSEIDEELSAARKRIRELEATAAARQKEVFMLNTKLAEAESMTHDVVRDLLGVKMDIASYATLLSQQKVQQIADKARRRTEEAHQKEEELQKLSDRLYELISERESWLEEINRRQAESVAARVSAEKLRLRDSLLANENEKLKVEVSSLRKKVTDLEEEYRKLSGQQNLQQRIHHHAKIKEENNALKSLNEDLSGKLRRTEILFSRVNDELARYRTAEGKTPFLNVDEEERLRKKLQETEENRMQLAQNFVSLCTAIITAAGVPRTSRDPDAASAMDALLQLQDRLEATERELLDQKLKARISIEKRRMSDLREQHTPRKSLATNFTANQQITSPDTSSR